MHEKKILFQPGAFLLFALIVFSLSGEETSALLVSAAVHELGHTLAMVFAGTPPCGIRLELSGPVLLVREPPSKWSALMILLAGPAAGLLLSLILHHSWPLCGEVSFLLSVLNLLPVVPLDGGRAIAAIFPNQLSMLLIILNYSIPLAMMIYSLFRIRCGQNSFGLIVFGAWLLFLTCQETRIDVK